MFRGCAFHGTSHSYIHDEKYFCKKGYIFVKKDQSISGLTWGVCHGGRHDKYNIYGNYVSTTIGKLLPPMHWLVHVNVIEVVVYI